MSVILSGYLTCGAAQEPAGYKLAEAELKGCADAYQRTFKARSNRNVSKL